MLDRVTHTVSLIESIADPKLISVQTDNYKQLVQTVGNIATLDLQPAPYRQKFEAQSQVLDRYIGALQRISTQTKSENAHYSVLSLNAAIKPELAQSLQSLNRYWTCERKSIEVFSMPDVSDSTAMTTSLRAHKSVAESMSGTKSGESRGGDVRSKIGNSDRRPPSNQAGFTPNYFLLIFLSFLGLFSLLYFNRKRNRAREYRRIINRPAAVTLNKKTSDMIIIDITRNGFKIEHDGQIEKAQTLKVQLNGKWHVGQIKWHNNFYAGVRFKKPIAEKSFRDIITNKARTTPDTVS